MFELEFRSETDPFLQTSDAFAYYPRHQMLLRQKQAQLGPNNVTAASHLVCVPIIGYAGTLPLPVMGCCPCL